MLADVITRVAGDTGYNLVDQRSALVSLAGRAASQMHKMLECNRIYRETTLVVQPDSVVSLPAFIGELRGMRMHTNELPFDLNSIASPRYVTTTLQYKFKNWRDLGESAVQVLPAVGQLVLSTAQVETVPAQILISGQTANALQVEEVVTLDAVAKLTVNAFGPQIYKIACLTKRNFDINVIDINGNLVAILYNTFSKTRYKLVDVSQIFWTIDSADGGSFIDVLYKLPLSVLLNDSDSFYAGDEYDEAWYHFCMHLYFVPLEGRQTDAATHLNLALTAMRSVKDGTEQQIIKKLNYGRNKFFGLFRKYRYFPGSVTNVDHNIQN